MAWWLGPGVPLKEYSGCKRVEHMLSILAVRINWFKVLGRKAEQCVSKMGQNASCCQEEQLEVPKEVVLHKFNDVEKNEDEDSRESPRNVKDITVEIDPKKPPKSDPGGQVGPDAGHRLQKPMSGSSRIEKMEQLAVDHEIVRGIPLRESLRNWGRLWRWSPLDLAEEDRKKLWTRSKKVEGFDIFLSHTWLTKGRWKVLTLLLRSGWHVMLLGWCLSVLLAMLLCQIGVLPMAANWTVILDDWQGDCGMGWWIWIFGISGGFLGLFLSVYIPGKSEVCFLDVTQFTVLMFFFFFSVFGHIFVLAADC